MSAHLAAVPPADSPPANDAPALVMPAHFKRNKKLRAVWDDLIDGTDQALHTRENRFTFEFAATLMAKFRAGKAMTATESKDLKKHMIALGLAKEDQGGKPQGGSKLSKYLG